MSLFSPFYNSRIQVSKPKYKLHLLLIKPKYKSQVLLLYTQVHARVGIGVTESFYELKNFPTLGTKVFTDAEFPIPVL